MTSRQDLINFILNKDATRSLPELEPLSDHELALMKVKIEYRNAVAQHNPFRVHIPRTRRTSSRRRNNK